jgi:hypothetical protein
LMDEQPYQPGTMSRTGNPWSRGSGSPFMWTASSARWRSSREKIQLAPGTYVRDGVASSSTPEMSTRDAPAAGRMRSRIAASGTPSQSATLMRP